MKGLLSFHPLDLAWFDRLAGPLVAGEKVNPEDYLSAAQRLRDNWYAADRWVRGIASLRAGTGPREADPDSGLWSRVRARMERIDYRPDRVARAVLSSVVPSLHLEGRPFLVAEGSAERVADVVRKYETAEGEDAVDEIARSQVARLHADLVPAVEPEEPPAITPGFTYRRDLLAKLRVLYDLAGAARRGETWREDGKPSEPARDVLIRTLPARAVALHARARPFWIARDVDGIETVCRAAGVEPPECLSPAWRPFSGICDEFPEVRERLGLEVGPGRPVGGWVAPADVRKLLDHLQEHGSAIIREAARHGEGDACTLLLRKIRECATFAEANGLGYLEATGIVPPHLADAGRP